jgi:hypothetical protein
MHSNGGRGLAEVNSSAAGDPAALVRRPSFGGTGTIDGDGGEWSRTVSAMLFWSGLEDVGWKWMGRFQSAAERR